MNRIAAEPDKLCLAIEKGQERYVFLCDDTAEDRSELLRTIGRFASDPALSLTWYDAAVLSQKVRQGVIQ